MRRALFVVAVLALGATSFGGADQQPAVRQPLHSHLSPLNDAWRGHYLTGEPSAYTYLDMSQTYNIAVLKAEVETLKAQVVNLHVRLTAIEPNEPTGDPNDDNISSSTNNSNPDKAPN